MSVPARVIVLDRYRDHDDGAWDRLIRDVIGGGNAATPLIEALDRPAEPLLTGVDVEAALATAEDPAYRDPFDPVVLPDSSNAVRGDSPGRLLCLSSPVTGLPQSSTSDGRP